MNTCQRFAFARRAGSALALMVLLAAPTWAVPMRIVAVTDQPAPGTSNDGTTSATFASFSQLGRLHGPVINNLGQVAFAGQLTLGSGGVSTPVNDLNNRGIWAEAPGGLSLVAREGDAAPQGGGLAFGDLIGDPVINDQGSVAFQAALGGTGEKGIWLGPTGNLFMVAQTGQQPPATDNPDIFFDTFGDPAVNGAGQIAFRSVLFGDGVDPTPGVNDRGIWADGTGNLRTVGRAGHDAMTPSGATPIAVSFAEFSDPLINDTGQVVFRAQLDGDTVNSTNDSGIWRINENGTMRLVVRTGTPAAGTSEDFAAVGLPSLNAFGQTAFAARVTGATTNSGIWIDRRNGAAPVVLAGQNAPHTDPDVLIQAVGSPVLSDTGRVAFGARLGGVNVLEDVNDRALWVQMAQGFRLVARAGEEAPVETTDVYFASDELLLDPVFNGRGQVAFMSHLTGTGVAEDVNDLAIFAWNTQGDLVKVARTGDEILVADGDVRTITDLHLRTGSGGGDGLGRSFNDGGELTFVATVTDGVATAEIIIVSNLMFGIDGDVDGDGDVDRDDLVLITRWYGSDEFPEGDFDLDGQITIFDVSILQGNYGFEPDPPPPPSSPVPEPSVFWLAAAALAALLGQRYRA